MTQLSITTTQNVDINFTAASVGERMLACLLDMIIKFAYIIVVYWLFFYLLGINKLIDGMDRWSAATIQIIFYLPAIFYSLILESMLEGQTFGKKLLKMKVVKIDGYQASFGDYFMRWAFRIVDINLSFAVVGLVSMVTSKKTQRLGDITAGTSVISLRNDININHTILEEIDSGYVPTYPSVIRLSDNDARIIKETFKAAMASHDVILINKLVAKIEEVAKIKNQSGNQADFIRTVLKDYNYYTGNM
ncbi:RDD family protein [Flavobacterium sp. NST-5]|uniref:RDD family protein n=1 Tax=Flavobacterium ichthyis TaxID=2698827 RepID=A0ABW9ZEY9_9FLAO|nr:RDD family protein [Flavobacterium ichthyis]NBL65338.1 RDD family protein [Flavobacterium ichthyis]